MALIKCKECEKEISDKAKTCPNCGCPLKEKNAINKMVVIGVPLTLALFVVVIIVLAKVTTYSTGEFSVVGEYQCDSYDKCQLNQKVILSENNVCSVPYKQSIQECTYTYSNDVIYITYTRNGYANGSLDGSYNWTLKVDGNILTDENGYTYTKQ